MRRMDHHHDEVLVIGAGPAGLAAAHEMAAAGRPVTVVERGPAPGGLCTSIDFDGCILDLGAHVFTAGRPRVQELWDGVLGDDQVMLRRKTRMYWEGSFFGYPPRPGEFALALGPARTARMAAAMIRGRLSRHDRPPAHLAETLERLYGPPLARECFGPYIEKLFGAPCDQLRPDWGPGRLREAGLGAVIRSAFSRPDDGLVPHPRRGTRQFHEKLVGRIKSLGGSVRLGCEVVRLEHDGGRIEALVVRDRQDDPEEVIPCHGPVISTMPLPLLLQRLSPALPEEVLREVAGLRFRSTILVYLIYDGGDLFDDHCIYVNDPDLRVGRVANFANWSPEMSPDPSRTPVCCEVWCDLGDAVWTLPDSDLVESARADLERMGLTRGRAVVNSKVIRLPRTHPLPISTPSRRVWEYLDGLSNLHPVGRAGAFSYQDQDDCLLMGFRAADACLASDAGSPIAVAGS